MKYYRVYSAEKKHVETFDYYGNAVATARKLKGHVVKWDSEDDVPEYVLSWKNGKMCWFEVVDEFMKGVEK